MISVDNNCAAGEVGAIRPFQCFQELPPLLSLLDAMALLFCHRRGCVWSGSGGDALNVSLTAVKTWALEK